MFIVISFFKSFIISKLRSNSLSSSSSLLVISSDNGDGGEIRVVILFFENRFERPRLLENNLMSIVLYDLNDSSSWSKLPHICRFQHLRKPNVVMSAAVVVFRIEQLWSKHALVCWNLNILSSELESRWSCCCVPNIFYQNKFNFL